MPDEIVIFRGEDKLWRWHKRAENHEITSTSGESFDSFDNAHRAASREAEGTDAEIVIRSEGK